MLSNCGGAFELMRPLHLKDEIYLSYLPLSHAYEHTVGQFFLLSLGTEIVYARGVEHLGADMLAVRPTILMAVPRVLEVIRMRVLTQVARETPFRQRLFERAIAIGLKRVDGERLKLVEHLLNPILDRWSGPRSAAASADAWLRRCPAGLGWSPRSVDSTSRSE
jgi:long-chain acyl-CoA synthetase